MPSKKRYAPPFTVSDRAMVRMTEIAASLERYRIAMEGPDGLRLRKINRFRTIHGSTAIEGNTLSLDQVTDVLSGKRIVAPKKEIAEIKAANAAYALIESVDPYSVEDLLRVHALMMHGLVKAPGTFRTQAVGVIDGSGTAVHVAPPCESVPTLVKGLFAWVKRAKVHPLVKSSVFHYEFEFIHPFLDGNGRMGRFWQTALLGKWNPLLYAAPVENMVFEHQREYYAALQRSSLLGDSGPFIDFMLDSILAAIKTHGKPEDDVGVNVGVNVGVKLTARERDLLDLLRLDGSLTAVRIAATYSISTRQAERLLASLKGKRLIARHGSDKTGQWVVRDMPHR